MFGVADESGQLQYGQVFIQYTKNSTLKLPGNKADKQVLTGMCFTIFLCNKSFRKNERYIKHLRTFL